MQCGLCGHERKYLGGSSDGTDLCHGCLDGFDCGRPTLGSPDGADTTGRSCYERWTVYKERPMVPQDGVRDEHDPLCLITEMTREDGSTFYMGTCSCEYAAQIRANERRKLWRLIEPAVTYIAAMNTAVPQDEVHVCDEFCSKPGGHLNIDGSA